ncbi:MAG TPA: rRNA maturation RNase YbeY [Candidatus Cybelea sp.]
MIHYRNDVRASGVNGRALVATARRLLGAIGERGSELSLSLVNDDTIRSLNRSYRGRDAATDVLSFPLESINSVEGGGALEPAVPERLLGDVVISVETAKRQAAAYDAPLQLELYRLLIHGLLHLKGHDHMAVSERRVMQREERRLADAIALPWPYATAH